MNTEVVASATSRDWDTAAYWIPVQRDWTRKLQVSSYLRGSASAGLQRPGRSAGGAARAVAVIPWETLRFRLLLGAGVLFVYLAGVVIAGLIARPPEAASGRGSGAQAGSHQDAAEGLP